MGSVGRESRRTLNGRLFIILGRRLPGVVLVRRRQEQDGPSWRKGNAAGAKGLSGNPSRHCKWINRVVEMIVINVAVVAGEIAGPEGGPRGAQRPIGATPCSARYPFPPSRLS